MNEHLEMKTVLRSIEAAFKPLRCVAEDWDYGQKVRFRVFSATDEPRLTVEEALWRRIREPDGLKFVVGEARANLESRGHRLEHWEPPSLKETP